MKDGNANVGPGWYDVCTAIWECQKDHTITIDVTLRVRKNKLGRLELLVMTTGYHTTGERAGQYKLGRSAIWQVANFKTMPALLYNQTLALDAALTEQEKEARALRQTPLFPPE